MIKEREINRPVPPGAKVLMERAIRASVLRRDATAALYNAELIEYYRATNRISPEYLGLAGNTVKHLRLLGKGAKAWFR